MRIDMNNQEIADKIFNSYFTVSSDNDKDLAKKHANCIIDAQIQLMFQDESVIIIDTKRDLFLEDWEEIKYLINIK